MVADIRERVSFAYSDVLSAEFRQFKNYDLVLGQNFMIHMNEASAETALAVSGGRSTTRRGSLPWRNGSRNEDKLIDLA